MAKYNIQKNKRTNGYWTKFDYNNKHYYADLSQIIEGFNECMIFDQTNLNLNGSSIGDEVFCERFIPVSEESLINCIEKFIVDNKNNNIE